jgi:uncharacterized protein YndB with AHSA1/START domain
MMPVKKDSSGRRSVEAEVDVSGTPEQVWHAIASGPGISSWFVPTTLEERVGGTTVSSFASNHSMDSQATITEWEPSRRFVAESVQEGPGTVATEWTVEAKAGGVCRVRVVHSWFADTDDWDNQFEGHSFGWMAFFSILRVYLEHFQGLPCRVVQLMAMSTEATAEAWGNLVRPLKLVDAHVKDPVKTPPGAPEMSGIIEVVNPPQRPGLILRLDKPTPAIAHLFAMPMGAKTMLPVRIYLYGKEAAALAGQIEAAWQRWLGEQFGPSAPAA